MRSKITYLFIILILSVSMSGCSKSAQSNENTQYIGIHTDYPVATSLEDMQRASTYILVGHFNGEYETWNMARNPENLSEEDEKNRVEGRLYQFEVEEVLRGDVTEETVAVNLTYSKAIESIVSNAEIDEEGNITKEATESKTYNYTVQDPLFIEPSTSDTYILFLLKNSQQNNFYGAIEPFRIRLEGDKAVLETNLTSGKAAQETVTMEDGQVFVVNMDVPAIEDFIKNETAETIKKLLVK